MGREREREERRGREGGEEREGKREGEKRRGRGEEGDIEPVKLKYA